MLRFSRPAFTLVELIVVVTIIAILGTVGFVSYSNYLTTARDSNRISQLTKISDALQVYSTTRRLPLPENPITITNEGNTLAYQGNLGETVLQTIDYSTDARDPKDNTSFTYFLSADRLNFQLLTFMEEQSSLQSFLPSLKQIHANIYVNRFPKTYGQRLGVLTDENNTPIQELSFVDDSLDIANTPLTLKSFLSDTEFVVDTGAAFTDLNSIIPERGRFWTVQNNAFIYNATLAQNNGGGNGGGGAPVNTNQTRDNCIGAPSDFTIFSGLVTGFESNIWNPQGNGTQSYPEEICLDYTFNSNPSPSNPWVSHWSIPGSGGNVIAYPNVYFGQKPWVNSMSGAYGDRILNRNISFSYNYNISLDEDYTNIYNASLNLWLTSTATANASGIEAEIMVWTENAGLTPLGNQVASNVSIGGRTYNLFYMPNISDASGNQSGSWDYYAFVGTSTQRSGTLPVRDFLQYLVTNNGLDSNLYLHQVEFGPELVQGVGTISYTQASVSGLELMPVSAFSFPARSFTSSDTTTRVTSDYVDIGNLTEIPRSFQVTSSDNQGNAVATSGNIIGGATQASSGELVYGTALEVDVPNSGETRTVSLNIGGVIGTWQVSRSGTPFAGFTVNDFTLTGGVTFYQLIFADAGIPAGFYPFTISGTGNTNPRLQQVGSGTPTNGTTQDWGLNIDIDVPPTGVQETITFVIDGVTVSWQIVGP